ncbi:MAG TPA: metallophosphoesterase, partial [Thermoanaerobaculia bacterium]|nr:metallophosphoesterase [Thermoanaerobaculia bacterium]
MIAPVSKRPSSIHSLLAIALCVLLWPAFTGADVLVPAGSTWRYLDNGSNQGTAWRHASFNDSAWATGAAQLGYGDGDETTTVSYGPNSNQKYVTTYFRRTFSVADPSAYASLLLSTLRDDGAVVYLNGVEVWRSNMPAGTIGHQTLASVSLGTPEEATYYDASLASSLLVAGQNVIAAEVHQADPTSTDISFDLHLEGLTTFVVTRGPYLQMGTPTSVIVRWRTNGPTNSRVRYGTAPGTLDVIVEDAALTTEHEITLTGLSPATTYYYSVGSSSQTLAGDASHTFMTPPTTAVPMRIWILGDSGAANEAARAVRDAYYTFTGSTATNLWLMLGDNAYDNGTDAEFQDAVFDLYPSMLRQSVLWPTLGNHDTAGSTTVTPSLPYFQIFSLPTAAEAGGVPSGTEKYYSFDYGNIHFVCLDSMTSDRSPTGPMMTWLENDLASTTKQWIIAFWHHPPYSKGSHDSDWETPLIEMRTNALPILEDYGVDLVLSGHSHSYERSYLIDSHYGASNTFISSMKKDGGSGRPEGTGAYQKQTSGLAPHEGAVYAVAGSSSIISGGALNHPAMFISLNDYGSMVLDVNGGRLDAKFLRENGLVADSFTIIKGPPATPPAAPSALTVEATSTTAVDLQWTDHSDNEDRFTIERCTGTMTTCDADPTLFASIAQPAANATTYSDSGLTASTTYSYRIRAENAFGNSAFSDTASATTDTPCEAPAVTLEPQTQTITVGASTTLTATATGTGPLTYEWYIGAPPETSTPISGATTATITVSPTTTTTYWVRVVNACGQADSAMATVVVEPCEYEVTPTSFNFGSPGGNGEVAITTDDPCAWSSSSSAAWITLNAGQSGTGSGETTFTVHANQGLQRSGTITVAGIEIAITQDAAPPPAAPTSVNAFAMSNHRIRATWSAAAGANGYEVLRRSPGGTFVVIGSTTATLYNDDTVTPATAYLYAVRALNAVGSSPQSAHDIALARGFTDGNFGAGTLVKADHLADRRIAVNAVRALAGLSAYPFTGSGSSGTPILAVQIAELRTALDEARALLELSTGGYTETLAPGVA